MGLGGIQANNGDRDHMSGPINGNQKLDLNPMQLATVLIFDLCGTTLSTGINQLGGFLGLRREAEMLGQALAALQHAKETLIGEWSRKVVVAPAGAMSIIEGRKP